MSEGGGVRKNMVFIALAMGMLSAAASQTIVSPALPVIVSDLGGVSHYSWAATSTLLVSAVTIPVIGKLSDIYGRREFFIAGLLVFALGSILAGASQSFWWLVGARAVQGLGMGTILPLAQTIIGDIISARERGKYMGYLGGVFGIASVSGPLLGGWITDNFGWRLLFYVNLPIIVAALGFIIAFLRIPHTPRRHDIDYIGFTTLGLGLVAVLLATTWGGGQYPWVSLPVLSLYVAGALAFAGFLVNERWYAREPVIPLRLWKNSVVTLGVVSNLAVSMGMFGAIFYIPVFAQGVLGASVTRSGTIVIPLTASMIATSIVVGRLITRTGRYKVFTLAGPLVMGLGYLLLTQLGYQSAQSEVRLDLIVVGLGLGAVLQTYVLIIQNAASREDLGVATSVAQLSRSVGAVIGLSLFGSILTNNLRSEVPEHLPPGAGSQAERISGGTGAGAVLDSGGLANLPDAVVAGIREGIAASIHPIFVVGVPIIGVAVLAGLFIKELPLRTTANVDEEPDESAARNGDPEKQPASRNGSPDSKAPYEKPVHKPTGDTERQPPRAQ